MDFANGNKLKGYLHKEAKRLGISSNSTYTIFFSRQFLKQIQQHKFTFIGGLSQFIHQKKLYRPLTDIDAITPNETVDVAYQVEKNLNQIESPIKFQMKEKFITTRNTACIKVLCHFDYIQHMIRFDLAQEINPHTIESILPPILKKDEPISIRHLNLEQNIANKMYVLLTELTKHHVNAKDLRRFKDLYDLYQLITHHEYDTAKVENYLNENFHKYQEIDKDLADIAYLDDAYVEKNREPFQKKQQQLQFSDQTDLSEIVDATKEHMEKVTKKK